jgi:hypothetical protein
MPLRNILAGLVLLAAASIAPGRLAAQDASSDSEAKWLKPLSRGGPATLTA